ncbi:SMR family transporter [Nonomuraea sp. B12E4]|uniref:DMT family transporter n=1 Tax=Nonomuraea sp. B12E4 TaxID=3153564 RepID=UPI00325CDB82
MGFGVFAVLSSGLLALSSLDLGTAYAVWTGIGAVGTAILGMALLGEDTSFILPLTIQRRDRDQEPGRAGGPAPHTRTLTAPSRDGRTAESSSDPPRVATGSRL